MEKFRTSTAAKLIPENVLTIKISNFKRIFEIKPNGIAKVSETIPITPVKKPKNIVAGITGKTKRLVIGAIKESVPILYKIKGRTKICVAMVAEAISLSPAFFGSHIKYFSNKGER